MNSKAKEMSLEQKAQQIMLRIGFEQPHEIYRATYYGTMLRNIIFEGVYEGKRAVIKIYDDPRMSNEPKSLESFHAHNTSTVVTAPALYAHELTTPHRGWFVMEQLPEGGQFFTHPLSADQRAELLKVYVEYRTHFPTEPTHPLTLAEQLPAAQFHLYRINHWMRMATEQEEEQRLAGEPMTLDIPKMISTFVRAEEIIRNEFTNRKMIWSHGHFKAPEVYKANISISNGEKYYLIDFGHMHAYPEGYEFGFLVWADVLMQMDAHSRFEDVAQRVQEWKTAFAPIAEQLHMTEFEKLANASIIERIMGSIFADFAANADIQREDKQHRINILMQLFDELAKQ